MQQYAFLHKAQFATEAQKRRDRIRMKDCLS